MKRALFALLSATLMMTAVHAQGGFGRYEGEVIAKWLDNGRNMELVEPFRFVDPHGTVWDAPKGSVIDGASIPQLAWTLVGGPYDQPYRNASVIHDVACVRKHRPWEDVHLAFYYAMRASGVAAMKAKVMYAAVYSFGPRWARKIVEIVPPTAVDPRIESLRRGVPAASVDIAVTDHVLEGVGLSGRKEALPTGLKEIRVTIAPPAALMTPESLNQLKTRIEAEDLSLEQIRSAIDNAR